MSGRRGGRPPLVVRLVTGLIRGEGAEYVRGDLDEAYFLAVSAGGRVRWLVDAVVAVLAWWMPRLTEVALNGRILAIGVIGSVLVGVLAGLVPALGQNGRDPVAHRATGSTETRGGLRLRLSLVAAQLALAAVLGVSATLLFRSFVNVATTHPGFDPAQLVSFTTGLSGRARSRCPHGSPGTSCSGTCARCPAPRRAG